MPINVVYPADPAIAGQAAYTGSQAQAEFERQQFLQQLAEKAREFDFGQNLDAQHIGLQTGLQAAQMGQNADQFSREQAYKYDALGAQQQTEQQRYRLEAAQQERQAQQFQAQQQQENARQQVAQHGELLRQQQAQQFQSNISDRKAIEDAWLKHRIDDNQHAAAMAQWSQRTGMAYNAPEQMAAQQQQGQQQQMMQSIADQAVDPLTGKQFMTADQIQNWLQMGVEPKDLMAHLTRMQAESRQQQKLHFDVNDAFNERKNRDVEAAAERVRANDAHIAEQVRPRDQTDQQIANTQRQEDFKAGTEKTAAILKVQKDTFELKRDWQSGVIKAEQAALQKGEDYTPPTEPNWDKIEQGHIADIERAYARTNGSSSGGKLDFAPDGLPILDDPSQVSLLPPGVKQFHTRDGRLMRAP